MTETLTSSLLYYTLPVLGVLVAVCAVTLFIDTLMRCAGSRLFRKEEDGNDY